MADDNYAPGKTVTFAEADITLYAIWSEKQVEEPGEELYTVIYELDDNLKKAGYTLTRSDSDSEGYTYTDNKK